MEPTPIGATVDYEKPGKQLGHLAVRYSHNLGGWANLQVPVAVLAAGEGPTVLLMAGNHGDEYPGQIAILKLCRELPLEVVRGRLIMIPALSVPVSKAAARLSGDAGALLDYPPLPHGGTLSIQTASESQWRFRRGRVGSPSRPRPTTF